MNILILTPDRVGSKLLQRLSYNDISKQKLLSSDLKGFE